MIRLHVLPVAHTISRKDYTVCSFTQKVLNFCKMFKDQGMHVIHYGHEDSEVACDEHVTIVSRKLFNDTYGEYDWKNKGLNCSHDTVVYKEFVANAIVEIGKRKKPLDFILCFWGGPQKEVCDAHPELIACEPSIGYPSQFAPFRVYESYATLHMHSGIEFTLDVKNHFYHPVIPSGLDVSQFEYKQDKQNYFVMCGRLGGGKGVHIASQVCEKIGAKLVLMGTTAGPKECWVGDAWPSHVEYIGYADVETRKHYMSNAKALFCPTLYTEPFGYVAIEAQLSGTPVISTDWGGFAETVLHGITGYRCRTFEQFCWAAKNIHTINPKDCREWAVKNYNQNRVGKMYKEYFESVLGLLSEKGWYTENETRVELDWLTKYYPNT